ncbi:hypothetical protein O3M35_010343 [Rhynocoris fuscipes]|uniref:ATP synthase F0 subunit 8 n=1 Tax=Rhynocoris fuscipes TaxID=488301 RepID=A0AAW1D4Q2_9HEMI
MCLGIFVFVFKFILLLLSSVYYILYYLKYPSTWFAIIMCGISLMIILAKSYVEPLVPVAKKNIG